MRLAPGRRGLPVKQWPQVLPFVLFGIHDGLQVVKESLYTLPCENFAGFGIAANSFDTLAFVLLLLRTARQRGATGNQIAADLEEAGGRTPASKAIKGNEQMA